VQFLPYLLARLPSVIQDDLFNAETSRAKSEGLTGPKSLACCNDSPDPCVTIRNHETYANCLSKPALTDLKAIHASQSTFDLWYSIKDSSRVDPIALDVLTNLSYFRIVVYWHTIEWYGKLKIKNMRFAQMFFPRELDELFTWEEKPMYGLFSRHSCIVPLDDSRSLLFPSCLSLLLEKHVLEGI